MLENIDALINRIKAELMTDQIERHLPLAQAIEEFFIAKRAQRLSVNTLNEYGFTFKKFLAFMGDDVLFHTIESRQIAAFLAQVTGKNKTVLNCHIALSSLWTWATREGLCALHVVRKVTPPEPEQTIIIPLKHDEFKRLMHQVDVVGKDVKRNRAILLLMLDTGVRATELCNLKIGDVQGNQIKVFGKGAKERQIPVSAAVLTALLEYLSIRRKASTKSPLFAVLGGGPMERNCLRQWLGRLGDGAGVVDVHPHRLRHTFAVNFLRNGGDAITLQKLLGHSTLDMVKIYVHLAEEDITAIHRRASPVENWHL